MSIPALLVLIGAALLAVPLVLYPLLARAAAAAAGRREYDRLKPVRLGNCVVVLAPGEDGDALRAAGITTTHDPESSRAAVFVFPGRDGELTPGGVERLLAPLADPTVGMSVGAPALPVVDDDAPGGPTAAALAYIERLHYGLRFTLVRLEASLGVPSSLHGAPCAVRAGFRGGSPARTLRRLAAARQRVYCLRGRRALVARRRPSDDVTDLRRKLIAETADELRFRGPHAGILVRFWGALLHGPALACLSVGAVWGALLELGLLYKLLLIPAAILAVGALVGRQTLGYGYRSRVYLPVYWLVEELFLGTRALFGGSRRAGGDS